MADAASLLAQTIHGKSRDAKAARWLTVAQVTAVDGTTFSATVDGREVTGISPLGSYAPSIGEPALIGTLRGEATVQYVGLGTTGATAAGLGYEEYIHTFDGGVVGAHPFGDEAGSGTEAQIQGGANMWFTATHNGGSGLAVKCDAISYSPGGFQRERQLVWSPPGPDPTDYDANPVPYWMDGWCEVEFSFAVMAWPTGADVMIFRFYPACAIYLRPTEATLMFAPTGRIPVPAGTTLTPFGFNVNLNTRYRVKLRLSRNGNNWAHMSRTGSSSTTWESLPYINNFGGQGGNENVLLAYGPWGPVTTGVAFTFGDFYLDNVAFRWEPGSWIGPEI